MSYVVFSAAAAKSQTWLECGSESQGCLAHQASQSTGRWDIRNIIAYWWVLMRRYVPITTWWANESSLAGSITSWSVIFSYIFVGSPWFSYKGRLLTWIILFFHYNWPCMIDQVNLRINNHFLWEYCSRTCLERPPFLPSKTVCQDRWSLIIGRTEITFCRCVATRTVVQSRRVVAHDRGRTRQVLLYWNHFSCPQCIII